MTQGPSPTSHISRIEFRAMLMSLIVSIALLGVKFAAYFVTRSNAVFSDALESIVNVAGASFALYSIHLAHQPADKEHPYGHGKIEFFSAGLEGGMILLAAVLIVGKVFMSAYSRQKFDFDNLLTGLWLMGIALLINGAVGFFLWLIGRRQGSLTLQADGIHLLTDAVTSVMVLIALFVVRFTGWRWVDGVTALIAAAYITYLGGGLVKTAFAGLMDEQDVSDQKLLRSILDAHVGPNGREPRICSYHKLRHRHSGRYHWVDFHMMVPAWWDIDKGHRAASQIEYEIECALGEGNATAHVEPCADAMCANCDADKAVAPLNADHQ